MINLIYFLFQNLEESYPKGDSQEHRMQRKRTDEFYNALFASLNDEQKEKLRLLENEYSNLGSIECEEYFIHGFKTAFKLILQALS